jgi:hypothetical protein
MDGMEGWSDFADAAEIIMAKLEAGVTEFIYAVGDEQIEATIDQLPELVSGGKIEDDTLIYHDGLSEWTAFSALKESMMPAPAEQEAEEAPAPAEEPEKEEAPEPAAEPAAEPVAEPAVSEGVPPEDTKVREPMLWRVIRACSLTYCCATGRRGGGRGTESCSSPRCGRPCRRGKGSKRKGEG